MPDVQLCEISKSLGGKSVLDSLNLQVDHGQYVVLLGESGCGKTTTLNLIAGLVSPDRGTIHIAGIDVTRVIPRKRDVSVMFQEDSLYPHLTVQKSVSVSVPKRCPSGERKSRVDSVLADLLLTELRDRKPSELSGGQKRRVALAKSMVRLSGVRLLDEPLSALDPKLRYELQEVILRWHRNTEGTTVHVTHDGLEAMRMADVIAVMNGGRIVQVASPRTLYHSPNSVASAFAIGSQPTPMNLIPSTLMDGELKPTTGRISLEILAPPTSKKILIGVRPTEWAAVNPSQAHEGGFVLTGQVKRQLFVDGSHFVSIEASGMEFSACVQAQVGETVRLFADRNHLHFFDESTGMRLEISH